MTNSRWKSCIIDWKTFRGAEAGSTNNNEISITPRKHEMHAKTNSTDKRC